MTETIAAVVGNIVEPPPGLEVTSSGHPGKQRNVLGWSASRGISQGYSDTSLEVYS